MSGITPARNSPFSGMCVVPPPKTRLLDLLRHLNRCRAGLVDANERWCRDRRRARRRTGCSVRPSKKVEETSGLVCLKDSLQGGQVGTGDRHLGDEAGGDEHLKGAQQFAAQVRNPEGVDGGAEQRCVEHGCLPPGIHRPALVWIGWLRLLRDARLDGDAGGSGA